MSALMSITACGLVLTGFAAEEFAERRCLAAGGLAPVDSLAVLAMILLAVGLTLMVVVAA